MVKRFKMKKTTHKSKEKKLKLCDFIKLKYGVN